MTVQLIRSARLPMPQRQVYVQHWYVDLAWPDRGVFLELDGEWHNDQPRYDAVRQTGVTAGRTLFINRTRLCVHLHNYSMLAIFQEQCPWAIGDKQPG